MNIDRELMQQALEALEFIRRIEQLGMVTDGTAKKAITALRERLAQPVQEPVAWMYESTCGQDFATPFEPPIYAKNVRPLYTAPPKREWVGLTEEVVIEEAEWHLGEMQVENCGADNIQAFVRAILAKAKEKTHD